MAINFAYVRENWGYQINEIRDMFGFNGYTEDLKKFIKDLLARDILKVVKCSGDNPDNEEEEFIYNGYNDDELIEFTKKYKFKFVGIAICRNRIIYAYPKYIGDTYRLPIYEPKRELCQVIKVIDKYSREKSRQYITDIRLFDDYSDNGVINNILPIIFYILEDYSQNGEYDKDEEVLELNGYGDVNWQRTVECMYPVISNQKPYYVEYYSRKNIAAEYNGSVVKTIF